MVRIDQNERPGWAARLVHCVERRFAVPRITPGRMYFALAVALATDGLQMLLGPLGWFLVDEVLDGVAMVLTCGALGFHLLLLPTFLLEMLPVADWLPTWTGCVAMVLMLRKRAEGQPPVLPAQEIPGDLPQKRAKVVEK